MWDEYKKIDNRIIRPLEGFEFILTTGHLYITDYFDFFDTKSFIDKCNNILTKIEPFNYSIKKMNNYFFWIKKPFKILLEEKKYKEIEEYEKYLEEEKNIIIPGLSLIDPEEKDIQLLFKFSLCQLKNNKTKLTFYANHVICDGRTIFSIYEIIKKIINNENIEYDKIKDTLCSFGQLSNYQNINSDLYEKVPENWLNISKTKLHILPKIKAPIYYINQHFIYDYLPISKFTKENKVSVQAMLTAMITRVVRKYLKLDNNQRIWNNTPCDSRPSIYSTENMKKRIFFCGASSVFPEIIGKDNLMEDIKYCYEQIKKAVNNLEHIIGILMLGNSIDSSTFKFKIIEGFPNFNLNPITTSSNIGKINGNTPLFGLCYDCPGEDYTYGIYSYHTEAKLYIMIIKPINSDIEFDSFVQKEMDLIFKL